MRLRDYQLKARQAILAAFAENDSALIVMPTGCGKTIIFADIIRSMFPKRSMVIAHRQELIWQAKEKIHKLTGLVADVEMGSIKARHADELFKRATVIVSTVQTLDSGGDGGGRRGKFNPEEFGLLIVDEAHHATAASYRRTIEYCRTNPKLKVLGVTATPDRADEEALGQVFETVAFDYEILDAIHDGWLVPVEQQIVEVLPLDLSSVRTTAGDLNGADLAKVMELESNLHNIATPTIEIIGDRRTLVFASSVKHAERLSEIFNRHRPGSSTWVCGATDKEERKRINERFNNGEIQILCNCGTHTEGFDSPGVECIVMARPTKSRSLYAQMVGRSTRPLEGVVDGPATPEARRAAIAESPKKSCLVIDFVGNSGRHKLVSSFDILGGNVSDEAIETAFEKARKGGAAVRSSDVLDESEEEIKKREAEKEARRLEAEARRAKLVARCDYSSQSIDPFDVLKINRNVEQRRGWDKGKQLSEKQCNVLRRQGVDPTQCDYASGKKLLDAIFARDLCSYKQRKILVRFGYSPNMSFKEAARVIDNLAKNGWKKPAMRPIPPPPVCKKNVPVFLTKPVAAEVEDNVPF